MATRYNNDTLAALLIERFNGMDKRVDQLTATVKEQNSRINKLEGAVNVLEDARREWERRENLAGIGANGNSVSIPKKWIVLAIGIGTGLGATIVRVVQELGK